MGSAAEPQAAAGITSAQGNARPRSLRSSVPVTLARSLPGGFVELQVGHVGPVESRAELVVLDRFEIEPEE